jgi:hypothetical protein
LPYDDPVTLNDDISGTVDEKDKKAPKKKGNLVE